VTEVGLSGLTKLLVSRENELGLRGSPRGGPSEGRAGNQRDQCKSSNKCLHHISPYLWSTVRDFPATGKTDASCPVFPKETGAVTSVVFALDAGFDPYSFKLSNGPGSVAHNAGVPQNQQTSWADSSRAGQWYNGNGYVGVSSPSYGTLTVFRQNSLPYDGVLEYDPMGAGYAFSPIGWQGITCGGGNTETADIRRH
jgi:hypothetical protein